MPRLLLKYFRIQIFILTFLFLPVAASFAQDTIPEKKIASDTIMIGSGKSNYDDLKTEGSVNSVNADLKLDDALKMAWIDLDVSGRVMTRYYGMKRKLKDKYRIALGTDYMLLNQLASYSYSDKVATSGIFRFFGTWKAFDTQKGTAGSLIFKIENRHKIGGGQIPRQLGYEAGSALSTASFKEFNWGLTNLYWKQNVANRFAFVLGILNAGDWIDLYPLQNAYKYYLNEAYFNSPVIALPNQGLGISIAIPFAENFYVSGGMHDANGQPTYFIADNFSSFFNQKEYFYWVEAGWRDTRSILGGETVHLTYWYQDDRVEAGTEVSRGWCFSASKDFSGYTPFLRAGISDGNAALMHHLIMLGIGIDAIRGDKFGFGLSWGGPNDRSRRDQYSTELFYAIQLTQHINIMPDIQLTLYPSFNDTQDLVAVFSTIRLRYSL